MEIGISGLRIVLCMLPVIGFQIVSSNYFQAIGKAKVSVFLSLLRQVIILIPLLSYYQIILVLQESGCVHLYQMGFLL